MSNCLWMSKSRSIFKMTPLGINSTETRYQYLQSEISQAAFQVRKEVLSVGSTMLPDGPPSVMFEVL